MNKKLQYLVKICILMIILICFAIYFININLSQNDEAFTFGLIDHNLRQIVQINMLDVHPPLYYILLKLFILLCSFWTKSVFIKIIIARMFSVCCLVIFICFANKILMLCNIHNGIWMYIFMIFPSVILMSTKIRMYSLASMFLIIEFYELIKFYKTNKNYDLIIGTFFSILSAYTVYASAISAGLFIFMFFIMACYTKKFYMSLKLLLSGISCLVSYIPWMPVLFNQLMFHSKNDNGNPVYSILSLIKMYLHNCLISFIQLNNHHLIDLPLILLVFICFIALTVYSFRISNNNIFNICLIMSLINCFSTIFISVLTCNNKFQLFIIYPIFSIYAFMMAFIIYQVIRSNKSIFYKYIGLFVVLISVMYSFSNIYSGVINQTTQSLVSLQNMNKWRNIHNHNIYLTLNKHLTNEGYTTLAQTYAQNSIYLSSINKSEILKNINYHFLSRYIVNTSNNTKLIKMTFNNIQIKE